MVVLLRGAWDSSPRSISPTNDRRFYLARISPADQVRSQNGTVVNGTTEMISHDKELQIQAYR